MLFICLFVKFCNMKEILSENKYLIVLWILCILGLVGFLGHYSGILIDFGREVYYPEQILQGKLLYRDLFNIYGPLSYQINAVLYKIFGAKLSTLFGAGILCSLLTVSGIYFVAQKFLSKFLSFALGLFTIVVGVTTISIFNFHFPYSWAVLYGLIAFLYSLYFLLDKRLTLSALLAGICVTCKYDFLLYGFVVLFFIFKSKDWKALLCFASVPILSFGILFAQGLKFSDLINTFSIVTEMAKSKTLTYFYQNSGIYFHPKALLTDLILFLKFAIPFGGILLGTWRNKKVITIISFIAAILFFDAKVMFGFLPVFLFCLFFVLYCCHSEHTLMRSFAFAQDDKCEESQHKISQRILFLSALLASAKVFWVLLMGSYGNYYVSILLIAALALLPRKFDKVTAIYFILLSIFIFSQNISAQPAEFPNKLVQYIKETTKPTDKIVVLPEGMMINFLTKRDSDGFYNSLLPLYVETFGEDNIIEHYKKNPPEYFILNNLDMKDYYFRYICGDYALDFCGFIVENYELVDVIEDGYRYSIFKQNRLINTRHPVLDTGSGNVNTKINIDSP